jgi:hypothetical protein
MKENNGRASRRKTTRRLLYGGVGATIVAALLLLVWNKLDEDPPPNPRLLRQARKHAMLHHLHDKDEAQIMKEVLAGDLQLIDVTVNEKELVRAPENSYAGVYGKFCQLDWSRRKVDPSAGRWCPRQVAEYVGRQCITNRSKNWWVSQCYLFNCFPCSLLLLVQYPCFVIWWMGHQVVNTHLQ